MPETNNTSEQSRSLSVDVQRTGDVLIYKARISQRAALAALGGSASIVLGTTFVRASYFRQIHSAGLTLPLLMVQLGIGVAAAIVTYRSKSAHIYFEEATARASKLLPLSATKSATKALAATLVAEQNSLVDECDTLLAIAGHTSITAVADVPRQILQSRRTVDLVAEEDDKRYPEPPAAADLENTTNETLLADLTGITPLPELKRSTETKQVRERERYWENKIRRITELKLSAIEPDVIPGGDDEQRSGDPGGPDETDRQSDPDPGPTPTVDRQADIPTDAAQQPDLSGLIDRAQRPSADEVSSNGGSANGNGNHGDGGN